MPKPITKAEMNRRIAEADESTNHFMQLRLKIEAITEYLNGLKVK